MAIFKAFKRCEELAVQPRGTRGESGGQTGWTVFGFIVGFKKNKCMTSVFMLFSFFRYHLWHFQQAQARILWGWARPEDDWWCEQALGRRQEVPVNSIKKLFNKTTGGTIMSTINNTYTSWVIPDICIICRYHIMVWSTICMAYLICTVSHVAKQYSKH